MTFDLTYQRAEGPSGGAEPGAIVLQQFLVDRFGGWNGGIYNPRRVRGSSTTWSIHAEGRAGDLMVPGGWGGSAEGRAIGDAAAEFLVANAPRLGVQQVIWWERDWREANGWTGYGGAHPHRDHVHWELTREAAAVLTAEMIVEVAAPPSPVVDVQVHPLDTGYWMVTAEGEVIPFGDCQHFGDMKGTVLNGPVIRIVCTASADGYWLFAEDGGVFAFGDAPFLGSVPEAV